MFECCNFIEHPIYQNAFTVPHDVATLNVINDKIGMQMVFEKWHNFVSYCYFFNQGYD